MNQDILLAAPQPQHSSRQGASSTLQETDETQTSRGFEIAPHIDLGDLSGGGGEEGTQPRNGQDNPGKAIQLGRSVTKALSKKQLATIFKMEPRTLRRTTDHNSTQDGPERLRQILHAAARRLTLTLASVDDIPQGLRRDPKEHDGKPTRASGKGRGHQSQEGQTIQNTSEAKTPQKAPDSRPAANRPCPHTNTQTSTSTLKDRPSGKGTGTNTRTATTNKRTPPVPKETRRTYALTQEEWPQPIHTIAGAEEAEVSLTEGGIYMVDDQEIARRVAYDTRESQAPIATVTPCQWDLNGLLPFRATIITCTIQEKGQQRYTTHEKSSIPIWIYNTTRTPAVKDKLKPVLKVGETKQMTGGLRIRLPTEGIPAHIRDLGLEASTRKEVERIIAPRTI